MIQGFLCDLGKSLNTSLHTHEKFREEASWLELADIMH